MGLVFEFFVDFWASVIGLLNLYSFKIGGSSFTLFEILLGLFLASVVINLFWKGAKG